jgi:hypothetical protein
MSTGLFVIWFLCSLCVASLLFLLLCPSVQSNHGLYILYIGIYYYERV